MTSPKRETDRSHKGRDPRIAAPFLLLIVGLMGCGGDTASPPDSPTPCPDQSYADLNLYVGRVSDLLYYVDVAQLLWAKGATDFFRSEISTRAEPYSRQEVHDGVTSALRYCEFGDSLRHLLDETALFADSLDHDGSWAPLFSRWCATIESNLEWGESLCDELSAHAAAVASEVAGEPSCPEEVALACQASLIAPDLPSLQQFAAEANRNEWAALFPTLTACAFDPWSQGWREIMQSLEASFLLQTEPFLGPVSRYHAAEAASVLPSWEKVSAWAGGSGALQIETSALARSGGAILVLFPEDAPVGGAYHHPFYLSHSASLSGIPQGTYRLLLFSSGARPFASEAFSIQAGETTTLRPSPARLEEDESCRLIGGEVPLWAVDPADEDHISNDYNLSCRTEIWAGRYVYQMLIPAAPNHRFRSEVDFQFTVDCADRSLHGEAVGSASVFVVGEGECALSDFTPDSFTVALSGFRRLDYIELELDADSTVHTMEFECSGTPVPYTVVVPDVPASLLLRVPDYGEVTFPPGIPDLPENTIYLHIYVTQLF